jgi:hypothetical protein
VLTFSIASSSGLLVDDSVDLPEDRQVEDRLDQIIDRLDALERR